MALGDLFSAAGLGGAIGQAVVRLELDTAKYTAEMKAAQGQTVASTNAMGGGVSKFGSLASAAFLGVGIAAVAGVAKAISAASDLNEQMNKTKVVFEDSAASVIAFSETTAESLGIAQAEALSAAGAFGQLFQAAGFAEKAAASMSIKMVQLAADVGSFNNIPVAEALEKLRGGLAGEAEPLRVLGVFLSEAAVKAEAYRAGIAEVGAELTDAQKIQARYNIIFAQTTKAQGDFSRTIGTSVPNQVKVLTAELTDMAAEIGTQLLPAVLELVTALRDLLDVLEDIFAVIPNTRDSVEELGGTLGKLGSEEAREASLALFDFGGALGRVDESTARSGESMEQITSTYRDFDGELHTIISTYKIFDDGSKLLVSKLEVQNEAVEKAGKGAERMAAQFGHAAKEIASSIKEEIPSIIGTVTTYKETFTLSPAELNKITESWARIARTIASDLREIADADLTPTMRRAIAALPPEMRHAWVEGNASQRAAIVSSIKQTYNIEETIDGLARQALTGGRSVGAALAAGTASGIAAGSSSIAVAASQAIQRAIVAARAAADAKSPSKEMAKLGVDMMVGLANGISDAEQKAIDAAKAAMEKVIGQVASVLDKIRGKSSAFGGTISGGIAAFGDIGGAFGAGELPLSDVIATQVGGAQQLAAILNALKAQGASKGLLAEVAETGAGFGQALLQGGPAQIQEANEALKTIADLSRQTGKALSESFFGDKIDKVEKKLDRLHDDLRELNELERRGHSHDIILNGEKVSEATRHELLRTGSRNPDIFGGRA